MLENARKKKFIIKETESFNIIKDHKDKELGLKGVHLNLTSYQYTQETFKYISREKINIIHAPVEISI